MWLFYINKNYSEVHLEECNGIDFRSNKIVIHYIDNGIEKTRKIDNNLLLWLLENEESAFKLFKQIQDDFNGSINHISGSSKFQDILKYN